LEGVQHINGIGKPDRINGAKSIPGGIFDDLQNSRPFFLNSF